MAKSRTVTPPLRFIVLTSLPLGERDTLLRIVEEHSGIRPVILHGARSQRPSTSRQSNSRKSLDLFERAVGVLSLRPAGMATLSTFERRPAFGGLREDLTKFAAAHLIAETALVLFDEQTEVDAGLYERVEGTLTAIDLAQSPRQTLRELTYGLIELLTFSGFGIRDGEATRPVPSPRLLREVVAAIERVAEKQLKATASVWQVLKRLSP